MTKKTDIMALLSDYYTIWQEYDYVYDKWAKAHGLARNSLLVLYSIYDGKEDITQKEISQRWLIPKQTVNMILKDFEQKEFVELLPMSMDKRNKYIKLTKKGRQYADKIILELKRSELSIIEEMGVERMERLNSDTALFIRLFKERTGMENE